MHAYIFLSLSGEILMICVVVCVLPPQAAAQEEPSGHMAAVGLQHASVEAVGATNCSSSPASSCPSLASLELLTDDTYAPNLEITLGRQHWNMEHQPEENSA
jgi:hypothetical protein